MSFKCREAFHTISKDLLRWFPGHMGKGMKQMQQKLKSVDCIIEVHDARIPFSGRNPNFRDQLTAIKPHVLIMNKMDLADMRRKDEIERRLLNHGVSYVAFSNCKDSNTETIRTLVPTVERLITGSERFSRTGNKEYCVMVIGVPNVGKSSLINCLRHKHLGKGRGTHVGANPGMTRSVLERIKISEDPHIYLLDTPGILSPQIRDIEAGLRLALCATLQDHTVGEDVIADYLLYLLNRRGDFRYVDVLGLTGPCDDVRLVLLRVAVKLGKTIKVKLHDGYKLRPDFKAAATHFIRAFRAGELGPLLLDEDHLDKGT